MSNTFKFTTNDVAELYTPLRYLNDYVDIVLMEHDKPNKSKKDMSDFLKDHHSSRNMIGFELYHNPIRRGGITELFFITQSENNRETEERFLKYNESGTISKTTDKYIEIEEEEYFNVQTFKFTEDLWYPLVFYNELEISRDPVDSIITEMESNNESTKVKLQLILEPISNNKWKKRYSLPYILKGMSKETFKASKFYGKATKNIFNLIFDVFKSFGRGRPSYKRNIKKLISNFKEGTKYIYNNIGWMRGIDFEEYERKEIGGDINYGRMEKKLDQKGYVANLRLVTVGENKDEVIKKSKNISNLIENIYSMEDETKDIKQKIVSKEKKTKSGQMEDLSNTMRRKSAVDRTGKLIERDPLFFLKRKRKYPIILTPKEISGIIHYVEDSKSENLL